MSSMVRFTLDGREASAPEGELLVHAAARHGVFIPTLCHDDKLDPYGGCRMCVVGVEGSPRPLPACATRVDGGDGRLDELLRPAVQADAHRDAPRRAPRPESGRAPERAHRPGGGARRRGAVHPPGRQAGALRGPEHAHGLHPDACILCNRCVRYTQEVMQCSALSLEGRGPHARIVPTWGRSWLDTECELCGGCLSVCPTGAIYEKFLEGTEQPERELVKTKTTCTFCGVGCQIDMNVDPETNRIVKMTSDPHYVSNEGNLCVKGRFAFNFVHHPDRLTEPLVRGEDGELHATSWEDALQVAADGLNRVKAEHGPQSIGFLASARLTMEENFLIQKLARSVVGTNSIHSCEAT